MYSLCCTFKLFVFISLSLLLVPYGVTLSNKRERKRLLIKPKSLFTSLFNLFKPTVQPPGKQMTMLFDLKETDVLIRKEVFDNILTPILKSLSSNLPPPLMYLSWWKLFSVLNNTQLHVEINTSNAYFNCFRHRWEWN